MRSMRIRSRSNTISIKEAMNLHQQIDDRYYYGRRRHDHFCYQRLQYCIKVLDKTAVDEQYFIFICKADQDQGGDVDYTDPVQHEKANPNYGVTIRPEEIANDAYQAQQDPQRKTFCQIAECLYRCHEGVFQH